MKAFKIEEEGFVRAGHEKQDPWRCRADECSSNFTQNFSQNFTRTYRARLHHIEGEKRELIYRQIERRALRVQLF
jgi:hypothetical protein